MLVKYGSYTGNGTTQGITGIGFQPKYVLIRRAPTTEVGTCHKTDTFTTTNSLIIPDTGTSNISTGITSLDADGFSVGSSTSANSNGVTYYYLAFGGTVNFKTGNYTGDGNNARDITGVGFQPDFVLVFRTTTAAFPAQRFASYDDANSQHLISSTPNPLEISALISDGFTVNNAARVNANGGAYHYVAWKSTSGVCFQGSYRGNGVDSRSITGVGFQPDAFFICRDKAGNSTRWRTASVAGDSSWFMPQYQATTNEIQAIESDGFQVGSGSATNPFMTKNVNGLVTASVKEFQALANVSVKLKDANPVNEEVHYIAWKNASSE